MSTIELNELLTVAQVAESLGVSVQTVRRWIREGDLDAVHLGSRAGASVRVAPAAVIRFVSIREPGGVTA